MLLALNVGAESPLRAWNIATPQLPIELKIEPGIRAEKFSSIALEGPLAVVSGDTAPMSVLDTSDPSRIAIHAQVDKPFGYAAARLRGGRAYVSTEVGGDGRFGVVIYDLEDPRNPRSLGSVRVPNGAGLSRVRSAARDLGYPPVEASLMRFMLDDLPLVQSVFPAALVRRREDAFVFPTAADALAYYGSALVDLIADPRRDAGHREPLMDRVGAAIQAIIEREGAFRVPKTAGCFVADV